MIMCDLSIEWRCVSKTEEPEHLAFKKQEELENNWYYKGTKVAQLGGRSGKVKDHHRLLKEQSLESAPTAGSISLPHN